MTGLPDAGPVHAEPILQQVLSAVRCVVWRISVPSFSTLYISESAAEILGYPVEAWHEPGFWQSVVHPDDRAEVAAAAAAAVERGEAFEREYRMLRSDGSTCWLHDTVAFVRDAQGTVVEMRGVALDVTARRVREDELRYDRTRQQIAMGLAGVSCWEWHADTGRIVGDPQGTTFLGRAGPGVRTLDDFLAAIHPDDRERVHGLARRSLGTGEDYRTAFRVHWPDGTLRYFESWGSPRGPDGAWDTLVGASRDVTDEHRALRDAQLRSILLDSLGEGVSVAGQDRRLLYVNAALERMFGYAPGELDGAPITVFSTRTPADYQRRAEEILDAVEAHGVWSGPMTSRRKDGSRLQTHGTLTRVTVDGEPLWITVRQDMTERHRLQREVLEATQREKEELAHQLHEGLGQQLTGTALLASSVRDVAVREASPLAVGAARLADLLLEAVGTCRRLAQGVSGFSVRQGGLGLGLRELALEFGRRYGGDCEVDADPEVAAALAPETARHLYWIAEDALAITGRHDALAGARLQLDREAGRARLRVSLPGIPPERFAALGGAALRIIGYRAALLGASLTTSAAQAGGVKVDCLFPTDGKAE